MLAQLTPYAGETVAEHRRAVQDWCRQLADLGLGRLGLPREDGGNREELLELARCLVHFDMSLFVKFGVHVGLVQGTIARLGSLHHRTWLQHTWSFAQLGCFAMTETDHGSNVRGLETRAVYLPATQEFEINTPHRGAWKDYIGSALSATGSGPRRATLAGAIYGPRPLGTALRTVGVASRPGLVSGTRLSVRAPEPLVGLFAVAVVRTTQRRGPVHGKNQGISLIDRSQVQLLGLRISPPAICLM